MVRIKKSGFLLLLMLLAVPVVMAQPKTSIYTFPEGYTIVETPQTYLKKDRSFQYNFFVYNASSGSVIDNSSLNCSFFLSSNTGDVIHSAGVDYLGDYWGLNIGGGNFSRAEEYFYGVSCNDGGLGAALSGAWVVTETGEETGNVYLFLILIFSSFLVLAVAIVMENEYIGFISASLFIVTGLFVIVYGIGNFLNMYTDSVGWVSLGLGLFFLISSAYAAIAKGGFFDPGGVLDSLDSDNWGS
jgi:hypothetical protein